MRLTWLSILIIVLLGIGCTEPEPPRVDKISEKKMKDPLLKMNKAHAAIEAGQIESYVKRHKWDMESTGSGLRYMIYEKGAHSNFPKKDNLARIAFSISLLSGTEVYTREDLGEAEFRVGQDEIETGIHELVTYMNVGDKAKVILPYHLAFGLLGDMKKIPIKSTLIYDVELLGIR